MNYFQKDYGSAREQFLSAAESKGFRQLRLRVPAEESSELYVDFAFLKRNPKKLLIHMSGLHGIEGYTGSAIQAKLLNDELDKKTLHSGDHSILFIHGLNAYGMAFYRRTNSNNVDLNRNFLLERKIINPDYASFHSFLAPKSKAALLFGYGQFFCQVVRHGKSRSLKAIASGQNTHPDGLFFAGNTIQRETLQVVEFLRSHFPDLEQAFVLDVHTGLGQNGKEFLFIDSGVPEQQKIWAASVFSRILDTPSEKEDTYQSLGVFSNALKAALPKASWQYFLQEFGTAGNFAVLRALRYENYAWQRRAENHKELHRAGNQLFSMFNPKSAVWRENSLRLGCERFKQLNQSLS